MIDVWLSVLVISFISAVGGLSALLIESCGGELLEHIKSAFALDVTDRRHFARKPFRKLGSRAASLKPRE